LAETPAPRYDENVLEFQGRRATTMRVSRLGTIVVVMAGVWCSASCATQAGGSDEVKLKVVKYDELCELVRANKGKVILLDFWATTCIPCKQSFPYTVEMHKQFAKEGLVVISVSTDPLRDTFNPPDPDFKDPRPKIEAFLRDKKATFTNVVLDESAKLLEEKLRITSIPCLYVFNRDGQWTQFIGKDLKVDEKSRPYQVEEYIKQLLSQPAKTASK
jgi:thiol-disulfide isomerase/thioredoxin